MSIVDSCGYFIEKVDFNQRAFLNDNIFELVTILFPINCDLE